MKVWKVQVSSQTAEGALNFLKGSALSIQNVTVLTWISFTPQIKGQNRILIADDAYVKKLADIITDIHRNSPLPIFLNILTDARFLGSQSSIASIAEDFAGILKNRGILHSTSEKFWKEMYACGGPSLLEAG